MPAAFRSKKTLVVFATATSLSLQHRTLLMCVALPSCDCDSVCQEQEGKSRPGPEKGKI